MIRYEFGGFELDADGRELRRCGGARVEASPKELAVLRALVCAAPRVVTRAELLETAWDGRRVSPSTLNTTIKSLRRTLDDESQRLVRTVHGIGYAFTAPVERRGTSAGLPVVAGARQRLFVGRKTELARLTSWCLEPSERDRARLYWVHGIGGIGKTMLLHQVEGLALERGVPVIALSCAHVQPSPEALLEAIATKCDASDVADVFRALAALGPAMLVLDGYEALRGLDDWVRERFVDRLPESLRLVIAGRIAPGARWRADPCWLDAVELPLADLTLEEAQALLAQRGVAAEERASIVRSAGGHPLTLVLAAMHQASQRHAGDGETELLASSLVESLLREAPSLRHREALECLAVAETLDEGLLAAVLGDEAAAADTFTWLATLGMVEHASTGLALHDLAKETLVKDLAWRNASRLGRLVEQVSARLFRVFEATRAPAERRRVVGSLCRILAMHPALMPLMKSRFEVGVPSAAEIDSVLGRVERLEGTASAAALRFWLARDPACARVLRDDDGGLRGYTVRVLVEPDDVEARDVDAVIRRLDAALPAPGVFSVTRWFADWDAYHAVTPVAFQCHVVAAELDLCALREDLAFHVVLLNARTDWDDVARTTFFDHTRIAIDAEDRTHTALVHDMRDRPLFAWFRETTGRLVSELKTAAYDAAAVAR